MNKSQIWYGFLEAGKRSTAVVVDPKINANMDGKLYIFNQQRNQILEYKKDIVESKLRDLTEEESQLLPTLKSSFELALKNFNIESNQSLPSTSTPVSSKENLATTKKEEKIDSLDLGIDLDMDVDLDLEND